MVNKLTYWNVLYPFLYKPGDQIHLMELSRMLKQPHTTIRLHLKEFEKEGIVKRTKKGKMSFYYLNLNHSLIEEYMSIVEKMKLLELMEQEPLLEISIEKIKKLLPSNALCLIFGSTVESFKKANDLDIFIVSDVKNIKKMDKVANKPVHVQYASDLSEILPIFRHEVIKKHLLISNSEQLLKWMYDEYRRV